jgi:hypothetical protein
VSDTRNADGTFGGPYLASGSPRELPIRSSSCGIPATAVGYSLNLTLVPLQSSQTIVTAWASGASQPVANAVVSPDGRVKANALIIGAGTNGAVKFATTSNTHLVVDINGYLVVDSNPSALAFYSMQPCRVADTRYAPGPFGGPHISANQTRTFAMLQSSCGIPYSAVAYSLNVTALPRTSGLAYLTIWPTGQSQPYVSTLNSWTGAIVANAAVAPGGAMGSIDVFASDDTDVILDINGYFAAPSASGKSFYPINPCRVYQEYSYMSGARTYPMTSGSCGMPSSAEAFAISVTATPSGGNGISDAVAGGSRDAAGIDVERF